MNFILNSIVTSRLAVAVHRTLEIAKKTNFNISLLQIGKKQYYKLGNFLLPIGASVITNWGSFLLQTGASVTTNWGSLIIKNQGKFYYKSLQLLQIRTAVITNWGNYYKLGHNNAPYH